MLDRRHVLADQRRYCVRVALARMKEWCERQHEVEPGTGDVQRKPRRVDVHLRAVIPRDQLQADALRECRPVHRYCVAAASRNRIAATSEASPFCVTELSGPRPHR